MHPPLTAEAIRRVDSAGMFEIVRDFPAQWREGRANSLQADVGFSVEDKNAVVVAGMGGSAIGADLLRTLAGDAAPVPIVVVRGYTLPAWVGPKTVVVLSSYSGGTEETLSAMDAAEARGATLACVASGGEVLERARTQGLPHIQVPGGLQPRAALGYSFSAVLTLAEKIGLVAVPAAAWAETQHTLEAQAARLSDLNGNEALSLAQALRDRLPLVYSAAGLLEAANLRWRGQIQENAKLPAAGNLYPELNHNEIMGWEAEPERLGRLGVVVLRDRTDHPRVQRRMDVTRDLLSPRAGFWTEIESPAESALARLLALVNLGDWVSLYLALIRGVDPTPVGLIQQLKDTLQQIPS